MRRVLIIDDEPDLREILQDFLGRSGYKVECAENGLIGLEKCRKRDFHVVLTNLSMPKMDGFEFIKNFLIDGFEFPVVVISGNTSQLTTLSALRLGVFDVIEKPFDLRRLLDVVNRASDLGSRVSRIKSIKADPDLEETDKSSFISHEIQEITYIKIKNHNFSA